MEHTLRSVGVQKVINTKNPPTLVNLATEDSSQKNSALSNVLWPMKESMQVPNSNYAALISLHSMSFYNSFNNIEEGTNVVQVLNTWTDNGVKDQRISTYTVPEGIYTITSLLDYLNGALSETDTYLYGLGNLSLNAGTIPAVEALTQTPDGAKIICQAPSIAAMDHTYNVAHQYTGFYFLLNEKTLPFMAKLGFVEYDFNNNLTLQENLTNTTSNTTQYGFGFDIVYNGANYEYFNRPTGILTAPDVINVAGPISLSVNLQSSSSNARNSYSQLSVTDTIATVPNLGSTGYKTFYEPKNPFQATVTNFQTNTWQIIIRDSGTGKLVDFQGANWQISLIVEILEIDNTVKSESSAKGNYTSHMPYLLGHRPTLKNTDHSSDNVPGQMGSLYQDPELHQSREKKRKIVTKVSHARGV